VESYGTKHGGAMRCQQRIAAGPQAVSSACGTCAPRLQQRHHPPRFPPSPDLIERLMPGQHRAPQGCDATPTREAMRRVRGDEAVQNGGDCQAPSHSEDQGHRR